jgi:Protein of unknown function (DUF3618)
VTQETTDGAQTPGVGLEPEADAEKDEIKPEAGTEADTGTAVKSSTETGTGTSAGPETGTGTGTGSGNSAETITGPGTGTGSKATGKPAAKFRSRAQAKPATPADVKAVIQPEPVSPADADPVHQHAPEPEPVNQPDPADLTGTADLIDTAIDTESEGQTVAENPEELREQVEQTREELGDTVAQLAAKVDVKERARVKLTETKVQAQQTAAKVATQVREHTPQPVQDAAAKTAHATEGKRTKLAAMSVALAAVLTALKLRKRHN